MKTNRVTSKRNKKYNPRAFIVPRGEIVATTPLWKKILKIILIVIACSLLIAAMIFRVRHYLIKHW